MDLSAPQQILDILKSHEIPFIIIGGHAVNVHGYIRTTEDMDIVFQRTKESEERLLAALESIHAYWISDTIDPKTRIEKTVPVTMAYLQSNHLMMLTTDIGYLDIFDYIPGFPEQPVQELFNTSITVDGFQFISLEWLIRIKEKSGRFKDLDDLEHLR